MKGITLTAKQIIEMVEFTGLVALAGKPEESDLENEYTLLFDEKGLEVKDEDGGPTEVYTHLILNSECPEEGTMPLGDPVSFHDPKQEKLSL